jgi:hypothetical protein
VITGWQLVVCYGLTLLAGIVVVLALIPPTPGNEVELIVGPPRVIYDTPPALPDRNPLR